MITSKNVNLKYLISVLNSYLIQNHAMIMFTNLQSFGTYAYGSKESLLNLPIPKISTEEMKPFIDYADRMLTLKERYHQTKSPPEQVQYKKQIDALDQEINRLVYGLYDLNEEEIRYLENSG